MLTSIACGRPILALRRTYLAMLALALLAAGCGGSAGLPPVAGAVDTTSAECDADESTANTGDDCGQVYVGLTDADGDFVTYAVSVTSLTLLRADGTVVETLPSSARVDFAQYTELTEFISAASVPPGTYVSGSISLDYSDAEIVVENGDDMTAAVVVDASGQPLVLAEMELILDKRKQLVVRPGIPSLLTIDFDLGASHEVRLDASPITAVAEPYLLAEIDPVDSKELRLRGPLRAIDVEQSTYLVNIRPFHLRQGVFGRATVHTDAATVFEVDGVPYEGSAGLEAMAALPVAAPTIAFGELNVMTRTYLAARVLAGSSVPGFDFDVVRGNVIAREGDTLKVSGAVLVPRQGQARFHRDVTIIMGANTRILKDGETQTLDLSAVSVGQRISAFGTASAATDMGIVLDASQGRIRMLMTRLNGMLNRVVPGQLDLALQSIDKRPIRIFDFAGTGLSEAVDADPANYEVDTGSLDLSAAGQGAPVRVFGFVEAFGSAPPDFVARSVADYSDARALLVIGWGFEGTATPFVSMGAEGIVPELGNPEIGGRHYIRQGGAFIDLLTLAVPPVIVPRSNLPGVFAIKQANRIWIHSDFSLFVEDLGGRLDGNTRVRAMYAKGGYQSDTSVFTAARIGVLLD